MTEDNELKQKPFAALATKKFKTLYKNRVELPERKEKPMAKHKKPKVYMTPELFKIVKEVYRQMGTGSKAERELFERINLSSASANKYLQMARKEVVEEQSTQKEEISLKEQLYHVREELAAAVRMRDAGTARHQTQIQELQAKHAREVSAFQEQLNTLTLEKTKLEAKVEVMSDLLKGK